MPDYTSPDELLAIVDDHNREIGAETRARIHRENLLHRAVHVLVFRTDGRLMIQKRSIHKDTFPLHWECVGGHLGPGEEYRDAGVREVHEEIGIAVQQLEFLAHIEASPASGYEFIEVYRATVESEPRCHEGEVEAYEWVDTSALGELTAERPFSPVFVHTLHSVGLLP